MREIVSAYFDQSISEKGYVDPQKVASDIVYDARIDSSRARKSIEHIIRYSPTCEHVYPDVEGFFARILQDPSSRIDIWTDDYLDRIASSGLGEFRRRLSDDQRKRLGVLSHPVDKHTKLFQVFDTSASRLVIVDDKEENLQRADVLAERIGVKDRCTFVLMERTSGTFQNGFIHVSEFAHLIPAVRPNTHWLVDFNGVCLDSHSYRIKREQDITDQLSTELPEERE